jgi:hypothetical protein
MSYLSFIVVFKRESGFVRGLRITEYNVITTRAKGRSAHGIEVTVHRVKGFPTIRRSKDPIMRSASADL